MQKHSVVGDSILRPLRSMRHVIPIVRHHHERWDGDGYPDSLEVENIPLEARVFQIADAFDALTNNRPYRKALGVEAGLETLKRESSSGKWDPTITKVFIEGVRDTEGIRSDR